jgi:nucleotide-binding universal stress UspA family protein
MKILISVDGSHHSDYAVKYVQALPWTDPPDVVLAHVCPVPDLLDMQAYITPQVEAVIKQRREEGASILNLAAENCRLWARTVDTQLLDGPVARELVGLASKLKVDLAVVGAQGKNAVNRFLLGSVSDAVAKHAHCSTLIVRPALPTASTDARKILIAVDGGESSKRAVQRFSAWRFGNHAQIELMRTYDSPGPYQVFRSHWESFEGKQQLALAKAFLQRQADDLSETAGNVRSELVPAENPADAILQRSESFQPDLIVVGSHGKTNWERILLGSTSLRILHHAKCSVWIERDSHRHEQPLARGGLSDDTTD